LNSGPAPALTADCMGQSDGYAPLWLRELVIESGKAQGVRVIEPTPTGEWIERAVEVSAQDHGPLLRAGIPALNISTFTQDYEASRERYHTRNDVFQNFEPASFRMVGATVEQAVLVLDTQHVLSHGEMNYWRVSPERYLAGVTVWLIQLLGLAPILLAGVFAARNLRAERIAGIGQLFVRPLIYLIPPVLALLVLYALTAANVLKRFELYPATPKDPFLYQLPTEVLLSLGLALLVGYFLLRSVRANLPREPQSFAVRKQILYLWVCAVVACAFLLNPFAMWLEMGAFACASLTLLTPRGIFSRALNAFMLLVAALPFAGLLYSFGKEIFLGWRILWYLVLQAAYGVWSPIAATTFLLAVVLWAQLLRVSLFAPMLPQEGRPPSAS
jgi:hypothetical protein